MRLVGSGDFNKVPAANTSVRFPISEPENKKKSKSLEGIDTFVIRCFLESPLYSDDGQCRCDANVHSTSVRLLDDRGKEDDREGKGV